MASVAKISWWQWLPIFGWRVVANVEAADEIPDRLPRRGAVVVGARVHPKWIAFDCPCGAGHRIMHPTDRAHSPRWRVSSTRKLTITPSIYYKSCSRRCHYFIRDGRVKWT